VIMVMNYHLGDLAVLPNETIYWQQEGHEAKIYFMLEKCLRHMCSYLSFQRGSSKCLESVSHL